MSANETLARRWLASEHWGGWRVGMVDAYSEIAVSHVCDCGCGRPVFMELSEAWGPCDLGDNMFHTAALAYRSLPDLDHPGTRAFLLKDVRAAHDEPCVSVRKVPFADRDRWFVEGPRVYGLSKIAIEDTESAALIAALEAAP